MDPGAGGGGGRVRSGFEGAWATSTFHSSTAAFSKSMRCGKQEYFSYSLAVLLTGSFLNCPLHETIRSISGNIL
ncbi:unnamed protein product [Urochloa humidicola]